MVEAQGVKGRVRVDDLFGLHLLGWVFLVVNVLVLVFFIFVGFVDLRSEFVQHGVDAVLEILPAQFRLLLDQFCHLLAPFALLLVELFIGGNLDVV